MPSLDLYAAIVMTGITAYFCYQWYILWKDTQQQRENYEK